MNTADYLLEFADDQRIAIITQEGQYSYHDLKAAMSSVALELNKIQVEPLERIGIISENSLFWVAAYLAILRVGAIAVPFSTVNSPEELISKLRFVNCKAICIDKRSFRKFSNAFSDNSLLIIADSLGHSESSGLLPPARDVDISQDAILMLTSGTTGKPRAVRITHRNIQANTNSITNYLDLEPSDRILVVLPFHYCFGLSLLNTHLRAGASLTLCNTFAYPESALDMLERTECTGLAGVPSTYQILLRNTTFPRRKFNTLRKVQQAGGKLPNLMIKELKDALPGAQVFIMYGQTEATARLSYLPPDLLDKKLGSIGRGIPGVELDVINEAGDKVKPGEVGEIIARGDNISPGYYNEPEANSERFINNTLHTGDLAIIDEDGFIYIMDRKSDFIKSSGRRISSQEIEAYILEISDVVSAAAVAVPDDLLGEAIKVFLTIRKGSDQTAEKILTYCRQRMARYMVPKEIVVVDSLPMNSYGKIRKSALRELSNMIKE